MSVLLQAKTPYDQSLLWKIHDAYFAQRGAAAWAQGDIPYKATCNYGIGRQLALYVVRAVRALEQEGRLARSAPITLLEVAGGSGQFTTNFFRALDHDDEVDGADLAPRLRYLFTDYSAKVVGEAATGTLAGLVADGRVVPLVLDMRRPEALQDLAGASVEERSIFAVFSNYACCVLPHKAIRKVDETWQELCVEVAVEPGEGKPPPEVAEVLAQAGRPGIFDALGITYHWEPIALERLFPTPIHARVIAESLRGMEVASLAYPYGFIDFLLRFRARLHPDGVILVNDFGVTDRSLYRGRQEIVPKIYGNSLNHQVNFALFRALEAAGEVSVLATDDPLRSTHTAAIRFSRFSRPLGEVFDATLKRRQDGEDMLDFDSTAQALTAQNQHARAAKFYARLIELDPGDWVWNHKMGEACIEAGQWPLALRSLTRGLELDREQTCDFEFQLGRAYALMRDHRAAIACYQRSLARADHPITRTNLAVQHQNLGDYQSAYFEIEAALRLDLECQPARTQLEVLRRLVWDQAIASFERTRAEETVSEEQR